MKAKKIYEHNAFQRGNPHKSLGIGKFATFKDKDYIILNQDIYFYNEEFHKNPPYKKISYYTFPKNLKLYYDYEWDDFFNNHITIKYDKTFSYKNWILDNPDVWERGPINENAFKQGRNPLDSIGLGRKAQIDNWFKQWAPDVDYEIDDNYNITVNGPLDLYDSDVTELPDNLTIKGYLDLHNTNITELPDNLTVTGSLILKYSDISELPDNLIFYGALNLSGTKISKLPDNLLIDGSLSLRGSKIFKLPKKLKVFGNLDIRSTNISELPENLFVHGNILKNF